MTGVIDNSLIDTSVFADSVSAFLPNTAYVAFSQDGMRPLAACVSPGDQVSEGDVIARSSGPTVTAVHTPIPGRVESFTTCLAPNGKKTLAAKIRLSGVFSYLGKPAQKEDLGGVKRSKLQVILAERGVLNTFLRPVALSSQIAALPPRRRCIIAVRLFDNDPSQRTDSFIAERYAPEVAEGAAILAGALNAGGVAFLFDKKTSPRSRRIYTAFDYPCAGAFCSADARKYPAGTMGEILKTVRESGGGPAFASIS
ncbi:MAG: hypothetical protein LBR23_02870, partial [Spirochaetaceae bacterium]|nr:hypothetical protein [Spirochaetaceae bacterium]